MERVKVGVQHSDVPRHKGCNPGVEHPMVLYCEDQLALLVESKINTPEVHHFLRAVAIEAAHQRERWKATDPIKDEADWYWLIGWLGGKAVTDPHEPDDKRTPQERKLHRIITVAAAAYNWHSSVKAGLA